MLLNSETKAIQEQLGNYCRTGEEHPIKGTIPKRLRQYRRLVYNVFDGVLEQAFPITKTLLSTEQWNTLVTHFVREHQPQEHEVWKMPRELYDYIQSVDYGTRLKMPFLEELVYFEWLEIEVHGMPDVVLPKVASKTISLESQLAFNPHHVLHQLSYPVHKSEATAYLDQLGEYFILIYRGLTDYNVHFLELSPFTALLFHLLITRPITIWQALCIICDEHDIERNDALGQQALSFIDLLREKEIVLGVISE